MAVCVGLDILNHIEPCSDLRTLRFVPFSIVAILQFSNIVDLRTAAKQNQRQKLSLAVAYVEGDMMDARAQILDNNCDFPLAGLCRLFLHMRTITKISSEVSVRTCVLWRREGVDANLNLA